MWRHISLDRAAILLGLVSQLSAVSLCHADGIDPKASARNGQTVTLKSFGTNPTPGSFIGGVATAVVEFPDTRTALTSKGNHQTGDTGNANDEGFTPDLFGALTEANARARWFTDLTFFDGSVNLGVDTSDSYADVEAGGDEGFALTRVDDPAIYLGASGKTFILNYGLVGGKFALQSFVEPSSAGSARTSATTNAGSNIPGLETLFSWTLSQDGKDPSNIILILTSNPLLGLDDAGIRNGILSRLNFDSATGTYSLGSDYDYISLQVTVPTGQDTVAFSWSTMANAEASSVAEPSSYMLVGLGTFGLLGYLWLPRKPARSTCRT
jgi:hypothetical protein